MYCPKCGTKLSIEQKFCSVCGNVVNQPQSTNQATPSGGSGSFAEPAGQAGMTATRLERHLRILAILWVVWAFLRLIPGIALLVFGSYWFSFVPMLGHMRALMGPIMGFAGAFLLAYAAAAFVAAWGLSEREPWARILAIVLAILALVHVPFGTALGIYTLWVMWPAESEAEYRRLSGRA